MSGRETPRIEMRQGRVRTTAAIAGVIAVTIALAAAPYQQDVRRAIQDQPFAQAASILLALLLSALVLFALALLAPLLSRRAAAGARVVSLAAAGSWLCFALFLGLLAGRSAWVPLLVLACVFSAALVVRSRRAAPPDREEAVPPHEVPRPTPARSQLAARIAAVAACSAVALSAFAAYVVEEMPAVRAACDESKDPGGIPVFPGAAGFGTRTPAGRGGKVLEVTSLEDSGPGTLRWAVSEPYPRVVVFRVGGTISLGSHLEILEPFITIAGQTAPGGGILLRDWGVAIMTHDVLVQHIRVRPGSSGAVDPEVNDPLAILSPGGDRSAAHDIVVDHVSLSWGEDEGLSVWAGAYNVTASWSVVSEALDLSRHPKGHHSAGVLVGDSANCVSLHHNLMAHNGFRNPLLAGGGTVDLVNNVAYDWDNLPAEIDDPDGSSCVNAVGNLYIPGASTTGKAREILVEGGQPRLYVSGNIGPSRPSAQVDDWEIVGTGYGGGPAPVSMRASTRCAAPPVPTADANSTLPLLLGAAGAMRPVRDAVDLRIASEVENRTGRIPNSPAEVGGYPAIPSGVAPADGDHDGMPDEWERARGLDPADSSDGGRDLDGDGYTNLEEYLHSLLG